MRYECFDRSPLFLALFSLCFLLPNSVDAAGTIFACDDFTEATPTVTLASHTPTTYSGCSVAGFTWGQGTGSGTLEIATTNRLSSPDSSNSTYFQSGGTAPDNANYTVQADFTTSSPFHVGLGIAVRWLTTGDKNSGYVVDHRSESWQLWQVNAGTYTAICTAAADTGVVSGTTITLTATGIGATVSLVVNKNGTDIIGGTANTCVDSSASRIVITGRPGVKNLYRDSGYLANWKATNEPVAAPPAATAPTRIMRLFEGFKIKFVSGRLIIQQKQ